MRTEIRYKIDAYIMLARTTTNEKLRNEWCNKAAELLNDFIEIDNCENSDSVEMFANECLHVSDNITKNNILFESYVLFCKRKNIVCVNKVCFGKSLSKLGFKAKVKKSGKTTCRGYLVEVIE